MKDDRIVGQPVGRQFGEPFGQLAVHFFDEVIIAGEILPNARRIGQEGRQRHHVRRHAPRRGAEQAGFMGGFIVEHGHEGLRPVSARAPVRRLAFSIPDRLGIDIAIIVGLGVVGAEIASRPHQFGIGAEVPGKLCHGAHLVRRRAAFGIDAGQDAKARRRADRRVGIDVAVQQTLFRQPVDRGRMGQPVAIGADIGIIILAHDPQDIGALTLGGLCQRA